jgi:hypothetical protein
MPSMWSAAGTALAFNVASPKYANLAPGLAFAIILANQTAADIAAGNFTIEGADASEDDACVPGDWAPLEQEPACDSLPGTVGGPATIVITADNPIKANSVCTYGIACPKQFIRVTGAAGGLDILAVVTRLKRNA